MRSGAELENLRAPGHSMVPTDTKDQPAPQPACLPEPPSSASPPPSHSAAMSLDPPPEELVGFLDLPQHASSTLRVPGLHAASISEARLQHALRESVPPKAGGTFADTPFSPAHPRQPRPTQGNPSPPKATQAHPRQPKPTRGDPSQPKATQAHPRQPKPTQGNPSLTQGNPSPPKATQAHPRQPKPTQGNPSLGLIHPPRIVEISPPSIAFSDVTPAAAAWLSAQESSFDNARLSSPAGTLHSHL
jgi:hypothetical protein